MYLMIAPTARRIRRLQYLLTSCYLFLFMVFPDCVYRVIEASRDANVAGGETFPEAMGRAESG
jgi:hypothetical protein